MMMSEGEMMSLLCQMCGVHVGSIIVSGRQVGVELLHMLHHARVHGEMRFCLSGVLCRSV